VSFVPIKRALISVSDKTGLEELGSALNAAGVAIVSTGSTAKTLAQAGIAVTEVSEVTGFPESLDGRVKTLHPSIHGGILADRTLDSHVEQLATLGIDAIDLVVVNLYPFVKTVQSGAGFDDTIEQIDIGGPAMVRAAAKNHKNVLIVVDPSDYHTVIDMVASGGSTNDVRRKFATKAFGHTAAYDTHVASWLAATDDSAPAPLQVGIVGELTDVLRYGENAHQRSALYSRPSATPGLAQAQVIQGKAMSHNNYLDADAALRAAFDHDKPCVAIIKHQNPCGIATNSDLVEAYRQALACDPVSAFGGVVATNRPITAEVAALIADVFTEVIIAPGVDAEAAKIFAEKKNLRVVVLPEGFAPESIEYRMISGGLLRQDVDNHFASASSWTLATGEPADAGTLSALEFAWRAVRAVKSNAILLAQNTATVGIGMGQVNRVDSCHLAVSRAGDRASGSVAASDAFFPFPDGLQVLLDAGVRAVVQPGGSVRDDEVIALAKERGVTLYLTGERHFFH
jgi:phosphoribosylaminoimidazolecarboxamide formyltransferase / IMP cyclohydrolase